MSSSADHDVLGARWVGAERRKRAPLEHKSRKGRWGIAVAAYLVLALLPVIFLVRMQEAEKNLRDFLTSDDRSIMSRSSLEYSSMLESLFRDAVVNSPANFSNVKLRVAILHNRLSIIAIDTSALVVLRSLPEFLAYVAALQTAVATADTVLAGETGATMSAAANATLVSAFIPVRPALEAAIAAVLANGARTRDSLQDVLTQMHQFMKVSLAAIVAASLLFVAVLGRNNWMIRNSHEELTSTTALLERSEARLHAFLQNAPVIMSIRDLAGRYQAINAKGEEFYGRSEAEIVGRDGADLVTSTGRTAVADLELGVLETGQVQSRQIYHDLGPRPSWLLNIKFPILDGAGKITAIGGIGLDITELKKSQDEVLRAKERAENANQAKSRMLANASHELRTPLNAIVGFGQVIEDEILGPVGILRYKEYAGDIVRSGRHLVDIVDSILDLSKVENGQTAIQEALCNPTEISTAAAKLVAAAAQHKGLTFEIDAGTALPDIRADRRALVQVLVNLLSNAIKFTNPGGAIAIACSHSDTGIDFIVSDTGIGIAETDIDLILLPFTRGGSPQVRNQEGTGLGLSIAKSLTEQHLGSLVLTSRLGEGTTATVHLPSEKIAPQPYSIRAG